MRVYVQELTRFKGLYDRINEEALVILSKCKLPAKKMINHLISVELAYINTNHPDFIGGSGALGGLFEKLAQVQRDEQRMIQQGAAAAAAGGPQSGPPARLTSGPAAAMRPSNARSFGDDVRQQLTHSSEPNRARGYSHCCWLAGVSRSDLALRACLKCPSPSRPRRP